MCRCSADVRNGDTLQALQNICKNYLRIFVKNLLRAKLREKGLSLLSVSEATGIGYSKLSRFQNGKEDLSRGEVEMIAKVLKCLPNEIVPDEVWSHGPSGETPGAATRKVVLPEATAKRAEEIMARGGYSSLDELVAEAVRRLTGDVQERILKWKDLENGGSAQKG